jgi:hypothetical protein
MDNKFIIDFYENPPAKDNFAVSPNNPIEIQDIKNQDTILKAIKELFPYLGMVNVKKVSFTIRDPNNDTAIWFGEGEVNENQLDITEIKSAKNNK